MAIFNRAPKCGAKHSNSGHRYYFPKIRVEKIPYPRSYS